MKLRGHHLFCTALFSGRGYDAAFAENIKAVIQRLVSGGTIELRAGPDAACAACPNRRKDGGCSLGTEDVLRRDRAAFQALGLAAGDLTTWEDAGRLLSQITEEGFQSVCGQCRWQQEGVCSLELLKEKLDSR